MSHKVLIISHDKVGPTMAGPGIRYHQIARELSKNFEVTLATFNPEYLKDMDEDVPYSYFDIDANNFELAFSKFDVIFALWLSPDMINYAKKHKIRLVFDLYAPVPVEELVGRVQSRRTDKVSDYDYSVSLGNYRNFFLNGDYFVCSNPIQKDYWIGYSFAANANLPSNYGNFDMYDRVGLLPMGIDIDELRGKRLMPDPFVKEFKAIDQDDFVIIWTGGIWDWFDADTPIRAIKQLVDSGNKKVKFVFLGTRHPNSEVPEMAETNRAYALAEELGLKDRYVFFKEGWMSYKSRIPYLMNASVALYAHKPSIEARYSHRTRVLDHFLASLPTISTSGDFLGDFAADEGMGIAVTPEDYNQMAHAIAELQSNKELYKTMCHTITSKQSQFSWEKMCTDLVDFINSSAHSRPKVVPPKIVSHSSKHVKLVKRAVPKPVKNQVKRLINR